MNTQEIQTISEVGQKLQQAGNQLASLASDDKFRREYESQKHIHAKLGISEEVYVKQRRREEGLDSTPPFSWPAQPAAYQQANR